MSNTMRPRATRVASCVEAARDLMAMQSRRLGMPVADPIRGGAEFERLVDACLA